MNVSELKKTKNYFRCVGSVYELKLTREDCSIKIKDADGNDDGVIDGERIRGSVAVKCDDGIHEFSVYFQSHNQRPNNSGSHDNNRWAMAEAMFDLNPMINGNGNPPTVVGVEGTVDINDYVNQSGNVSSGLRYNISSINTKVEEEEPHVFAWNGILFVKAINDEMISEKETGRKVVDFIAVNGKSEVVPIKAFVEADIVEDFEDAVDIGETRNFNIEIIARHVGGATQTQKKKAFGRDTRVSTNKGFDVTEWIIVGCDDIIEAVEDEEGNFIDNGYLNPKAISKGLKERAKKLESLKEAGPATKGSNSFADKKSKAKKEAFTDSNPFDDDDEF